MANRKRGQLLTRLSKETRDKLDELRARSLRHFPSYDALILELVNRALVNRGLPLPSRQAVEQIKAAGTLTSGRSAAGAPDRRPKPHPATNAQPPIPEPVRAHVKAS